MEKEPVDSGNEEVKNSVRKTWLAQDEGRHAFLAELSTRLSNMPDDSAAHPRVGRP